MSFSKKGFKSFAVFALSFKCLKRGRLKDVIYGVLQLPGKVERNLKKLSPSLFNFLFFCFLVLWQHIITTAFRVLKKERESERHFFTFLHETYWENSFNKNHFRMRLSLVSDEKSPRVNFAMIMNKTIADSEARVWKTARVKASNQGNK